jgi:hypothetical protein
VALSLTVLFNLEALLQTAAFGRIMRLNSALREKNAE